MEFIFNSFLSYLLLMLIIVVVAAIGFTIGRILRKMKNNSQVNEVSEAENIE